MYYYHFTHYAGHDRVFSSDHRFGEPGDLLRVGVEYMLVLGDEVARKEQHTKVWKSTVQPEVILPGLLSEKTLTMLHRMVEHRFTTYKNVVPLRVGDIDELLKNAPKVLSTGKRKKFKPTYHLLGVNDGRLQSADEKKEGQQLIVFPDVRTMGAYTATLDENQQKELVTLHSQTTAKQKSKIFRELKTGKASTLCCTYSQLFQDWLSLDHILLVDQHKWYYKSQQDPRYYVPTVVEQLAQTQGSVLEMSGLSLG